MKISQITRTGNQKLVLFFAASVFLPLPLNVGLAAGFEPLIPDGLFGLGYMTIFALFAGEIGYFIFFGGQLVGLTLFNYFLAWASHKLLSKLGQRASGEVPWLHVVFVAVAFLLIYLVTGGGRSWA